MFTESRALLPDTVNFAYIPKAELRIHAESQDTSKRRENSPDYAAFGSQGASTSSVGAAADDDEHVLVLDLQENSRGKKSSNPGFAHGLPPALTPEATKKLINKRNERFIQAVNELLEATSEHDDPVTLLQAAARDHIPIDPSSRTFNKLSQSDSKGNQRIVPDPADRPAVDAVIEEIEEQEWYQDQIVDKRIVEAKDGHIEEIDPPLSETIAKALRDSRKITSLYTHQVAAIRALSQGKHVIVSTSTASGKSVIYQALAQDQRLALEQLLYTCPGLEHIKVYNYDGDTPQELRAGIRESASVIFTNFDMLHASILPHEDLWRRFLKNLKLVAVDELHYYSNIFGSATIAKPKQHMQSIFGIEDVEEVTEDGAPSGRKDYLVWNPPLIDPMDETSGRRGSLTEATRLMRFLMARGIRVILFCKIRKSCELAMKALRSELAADGRQDILDRVMAYRGGYSQHDRRKIEAEAFSGNLLGIVATNALELGVDIGVLDAVIMLGFPMGGLASFRQQADQFPIDQHYVKNPSELFDKPMNDLVIDLDSKVMLEAHLQCAAHEMPLMGDDAVYFGPYMKEICDTRLTKDKDGWCVFSETS
ncbi:hypothetical protein EVJ58_g5016 [Rhodofomes roseus]|uniref:P-loop containing nucleoside triphosphate hydrolase protein n=1 Tax=Rhodofomes roseus TaxID=34475 RepID=A0A4Y9YDL1_9APHY|nr:hypothetical protein EVJ58_g5016 [Rhodofomes roseus]